jgi:hypothetical protein
VYAITLADAADRRLRHSARRPLDYDDGAVGDDLRRGSGAS